MKSKSSIQLRRFAYGAFAGLNTAQADISLESPLPGKQALVEADNVVFSRNGWVSNERGMEPISTVSVSVVHARWFSSDGSILVYAEEDGSGISVRVTNGPSVAQAWPVGSVVSSSIFRRKAILTSAGQVPLVYDGSSWSTINALQARGAAFSCSVQNRLVLAGFPNDPNEIVVSRVNDEQVMPNDEEPGNSSAIKAFRFNIGNLLGTSDVIVGICAFESNKLAIFTNDRVLIYRADPDLTQWTLDSNVNINVGAISHNSIAGSIDEILFCSRRGVHSVRRSVTNGTTMFTLPLSDEVSELYQTLIDNAMKLASVSAFFDQDEGRYHVCFRQSANASTRLSVALTPAGSEAGVSIGKWTTSTAFGALCGDSLAGNVAVGCIAGLRLMARPGAISLNRGEGTFSTPILWQGDINEPKKSAFLSIISSGYGKVMCEATDQDGRQLSTVVFDIPKPGTVGSFAEKSQFDRQFEHVYVGVKVKVRILSEDQLRIFAIGITTREE